MSIRSYGSLMSRIPLLKATALALLVMELIGALVLPALLPESWYLQSYLGAEAGSVTRRFLARQQYLVPDEVTGWRNAANYRAGNWATDGYGALLSTNTSPAGATEVLLFGSSLVNGGRLQSTSPISAYLPASDFRAVNFGTMLYAVDQSFLLYRDVARHFQARHVVVGLDSDPLQLLGSVYVPLVEREQLQMPFLKPRLRDDATAMSTLPLRLLELPAGAVELRQFIQHQDREAWRYELYRRTAYTPIAVVVRGGILRVHSLWRRVRGEPAAERQLLQLLTRMRDEVAGHRAKLSLICFPSRFQTEPGRLRRLLPDHYGARIASLRAAGFVVIDVRAVLKEARLGGDAAWSGDGIHPTAAANHVIAIALDAALRSQSEVR